MLGKKYCGCILFVSFCWPSCAIVATNSRVVKATSWVWNSVSNYSRCWGTSHTRAPFTPVQREMDLTCIERGKKNKVNRCGQEYSRWFASLPFWWRPLKAAATHHIKDGDFSSLQITAIAFRQRTWIGCAAPSETTPAADLVQACTVSKCYILISESYLL